MLTLNWAKLQRHIVIAWKGVIDCDETVQNTQESQYVTGTRFVSRVNVPKCPDHFALWYIQTPRLRRLSPYLKPDRTSQTIEKASELPNHSCALYRSCSTDDTVLWPRILIELHVRAGPTHRPAIFLVHLSFIRVALAKICCMFSLAKPACPSYVVVSATRRKSW